MIPTLNNWRLTKRCLETLLEHGGAELAEVIVVDNASTDRTRAELPGFPAVKTILFPENYGFAVASNAGARASTGDAILFLNNDAFTHPGALRALLATLDASEAGIVGARLLYGDGTLQHAGMAMLANGLWWHLHWYLEGDFPDALVSREYAAVTAAAMLMRRPVFDLLGGFDENYRNGYEDVDLCLRAWHLGVRIRYEPAATFTHLESATPGRVANDQANYHRFITRWGPLMEAMPKFPLDLAPPIAIVGTIGGGDVPAQAARQFAWEYAGQSAGARHYPHYPVSPQMLPVINPLVASTVNPAVIFEWGDDLPPAQGKRISYVAPLDAAHASAIAARKTDGFWVPTEHARSLLLGCGVHPSRIELVRVGIDCDRFTPAAPPYHFGREGLLALAVADARTSAADLGALLEVTAQLGPGATLIVVSPEPGAALEGRLRTALAETGARNVAAPVVVASTQSSPDALIGGFFTGTALYIDAGGDPYGYALLAAMASGALIAALDRAPATEFVTSESALIAATPAELGRRAAEALLSPAAPALRETARFDALRRFPSALTGRRAAALMRRFFWGPRDASGVAISEESARLIRSYQLPF